MSKEAPCDWYTQMREMLISQVLKQWPEIVHALITEAQWTSSAEDRKAALQALISLLQYFGVDSTA